MRFSDYLFLLLVRPRFSGPLGALAILGLGLWGVSAARLLRQIEDHAPTEMSLADAVKASRDGEVYARLTDAVPDCTKVLTWSAGRTVALANADGEVAAMARLETCPGLRPERLEGVFLDPPNGLYGAAVARGWSVTRGHLAYLDADTRSSRARTRIAVGVAATPMWVGCFVSGLCAEREARRRRVWRTRALGFGLLAALAWFAYYAHQYTVAGVVPALALAAVGLAVSLLLVVLPDAPYTRRVAERILPPEGR